MNLLELILIDLQEIVKTKSVCSYFQALWIYGLLGCLEKPLLIESCGVLVKLLKIFYCFIENYDKKFNDYNSYIGMMNVLIAVINIYFEQKIIVNE